MAAVQSHTGKTAIVTGAANGIGRAIAVGLALHGANVVACDRSDPSETVALLSAEGSPGLGVVCDITSQADIDRLADLTHETYGPCDILVNNAASLVAGDLASTTRETWRQVVEVNLEGTFLVTKKFAPDMTARNWGRIVMVASASLYSGPRGQLAYVTSKAGLLGMTSALAAELGAHEVTVNAVSPAVTPTPGTLRGVEDGLVPENLFELAARQQSIPRVGCPEDVVAPVLFLTSDGAYLVTGQFIVADGGRTRHY